MHIEFVGAAQTVTGSMHLVRTKQATVLLDYPPPELEANQFAAAVLMLELGIGANTALFAVVEAVLLRPLPFANAGELVLVKHRDTGTGLTKSDIGIGDFIDLAARQQSFTTFAVSAPKKIRSPSCAPVRDMMPLTASSLRNLRIGDCRPSRPLAFSLTFT